MSSAEESWESRVSQAGADILNIAETTILVVVDDSPLGPTWRHPVWPLCRSLAALGFGAIHLRAPNGYFEALSPLMHGAWFVQEGADGPDPVSCEENAEYDVVLHLGNDPRARRRCAEFEPPCPAFFASLAWGPTWSSLLSSPSPLDEFASQDIGDVGEQEPPAPIVRIAAGLGLQEALIVAGRLQSAARVNSVVSFDATTETRVPDDSGIPWPPAWIESASIDVMGAGAIGTHLCESLTPLLGVACELRIFDPDCVGPENLSVQPVYASEDIGRSKAEVMAEKLKAVSDPGLKIIPMVMRYEDRPQKLARPSLRVACPDTFSARKYANDCSIADGVPLVEAGCSPLTAQQRSYLPGRTSCLEHRLASLANRAAGEQDRASCTLEQALTLPGTTMIAGGILALEALRALDPQRFGWPSRGTVTYDARFPNRFGVIDLRAPCVHR
jgi:molybdopterin/thiamine biosynthesis adenylyltransferase